MAGLPGCYAQPDGAILIASVMTESGSRDAGAVAVRPLPEKAKSWQSIAAAAAAAEDSGIPMPFNSATSNHSQIILTERYKT